MNRTKENRDNNNSTCSNNNNINNISRNNNSTINGKWIIWKSETSRKKNKICKCKRNSQYEINGNTSGLYRK